ncbi:MAG: hypothetical protein GY842_15150 [bacterium]|nr:hypothetical protein [bacterium]
MHPRVQSLPPPQPDYRNFLAAVRRQDTKAIPLIELAVDPGVVASLGETPIPPERGDGVSRDVVRTTVRLLHRLGYDVVKMSLPIPFQIGTLRASDAEGRDPSRRRWQDQYGGCIQTMNDLQAYRWPCSGDLNTEAFEQAVEVLPDGMALLGFSGGVLEFTTELIGLERFMYSVYDAPDLLAGVFEGVGQTIYEALETCCQFDEVCALWLGDDLGSKNGLLVSPDLLRKHVFPWYRRYRELAHRCGRPFLLHSCGNTETVMADLAEDVGIDAKHSFEDTIMPVEAFIDRWGSKVGTLGGISVDLLARGSQEAVADRTLQVLEHASSRGGYACGSGNSIPDYVPPENYLAMIETVLRFNGRA